MKYATDVKPDADAGAIRAILIHTDLQRVVETWIQPELDAYTKTIGCQRIDFAYPQFLSERGETVVVDDEAMFSTKRPAICWTLGAPCFQPYFGSGLIVGTDDATGETASTSFDLEEVRAALRFATPQMQINGKTVYQSVPGDDFLIWDEEAMRFRKVRR